MRRRVFTCGFPYHVEDHGPSHHLTVIPTAGGAASAAAAQPRIGATRGGVAVRDFRVFDRGQYEYEYERLRIKCAKAATLGYWTPSELLSFGLVAVLESNRLAISRTSAHLVTSASHLEHLPPLIGLDTARRVDGLYTLSL